MRVADEDRQLSAREIENIILSRNREAMRWDNEIAAPPWMIWMQASSNSLSRKPDWFGIIQAMHWKSLV